LDADLVSTVVYARHYYGGCPAWIETEARARRGDIYLLHHPDVTWLPDGGRDRPRERLGRHRLLEGGLRGNGAKVIDIRGSWAERDARAAAAVAELLATVPGRSSSSPGSN